MKLFEFEAKEFFRASGIPVPDGIVCKTQEEAGTAYKSLGGGVMCKSQVLAGGRGKAGGIQFAGSEMEAVEITGRLLDMKIKNEAVEKILVEKALDIEKEYYLGIITDPDESCPLLMFSAEGGMEIEDLAVTHPEAIRKVPIDPRYGLFAYRILYELRKAGIEKGLQGKIAAIAKRLYETFWSMDGELIEINPLVVTKKGEVFAADAKFNIDNSGLFRQPKVPKRPPRNTEERAKELGLSYVQLEGDIGIISNGAGLTMSAMDYIRLKGAAPANFLDLGGGATRSETIKNGIRIVLENPRVNAILIYIFAGGPRCDVIAKGIVEAVEELEKDKELNVPLVVTLHGRYYEKGMEIISTCESSHVIQVLEVEDAVNKAIELGGEQK